MSGVWDYRLQRRRMYDQARIDAIRESERLNKALDKMAGITESLASEIKNNEEFRKEIEENNLKTLDAIDEMKRSGQEFDKNFKNERIEALKSLKNEISYLSNNALNEITDEAIKDISNAHDKIEIIDIFSKCRVYVEYETEKIIKQAKEEKELFELFGIKTEEDLKNEEKLNLMEVYLNLKEAGYEPVYNPEEKRIYCLTENDNEIVSYVEGDKVKSEFNNFEARTCTKDMQKIAKHLIKTGAIQPGTTIYTDWYSDKNPPKSGAVLKNKNIYEQLKQAQQKQGKING